MGKKFFLVDGHSHLYRAFFAVRGLSTTDGRPTNAVFGFTSMLRKLIDSYQPDYLAVAFDMPGPTFRHEMYADYKAKRQAPPDELIEQIPMVHRLLEGMRIAVLTKQGYEADDILGALARRGAEKGFDVTVVTGDKDMNQLLGPRVTVLDTMKDRVTTAESLRKELGFGPDKVTDMMALSGDASDNIPGVPKVGPKTAVKLIRDYGDLENVLAHASEVKGKTLRKNLTEYADQARLSKKLATIDTRVPMDIEFESLRYAPPDPERMRPIYQDLGFHQFLRDMGTAPTREETAYRLVDNDKSLKDFLSALRERKRFAVDLETTSASPMAAKIVGLSFSWAEREAWYLPVRAPVGEKTLGEKKTLAALKPVLEDDAFGKVGQNLKYDAVVLRNHNVLLKGIVFDSMLAAYVLNATRRRYGLDELAQSFLGVAMTPISDLIGKGRKQITMDAVPVEAVRDYACADADIAFRLTRLFEKELAPQGLAELFRTVELPLIDVLVEMECNGIRLDADSLTELSAWLAGQLEALEKKIHAAAGKEFNVASPKQLGAILFGDLALPVRKKTRTGPSTDSEVLADLAIEHPLPALVLEYRQLSKLKSTYVDALPGMILPATGRIHTSFNQTATATGRLSSSDPNLQNIPVRTEIGEPIRRAFVPSRDGCILLSADYSQIELRILAHLCGDEGLCDAFVRDRDIHRFVAAQIHGVDEDDVDASMRRAAKAVNFGIIYGLSPYGLSRDLRIPVAEAKRFIDGYFERYPGVRSFIEETVARAREEGHVVTLCGRRRALAGLNDANRAVRSFSERAAVNTVIQGTAADMIKIAMIRIHGRLKAAPTDVRMLLQIHDELLFELPEAETPAFGKLVREEMSGALELDVPIKVNIATGRNWLEAK